MTDINIKILDHTYKIPKSIRDDADEYFEVTINAVEAFLYCVSGSLSEKQLREEFEKLIQKIKEKGGGEERK